MNEMELHRGTAVLVAKAENETLEDVCKRICEKEGYRLDKCINCFVELLQDDGWEKYIIVKGDVYKLQNKELDCYDSFYDVKQNEDGSYAYLTQFYNGGTCLTEMLEEALEEIISKESEEGEKNEN